MRCLLDSFISVFQGGKKAKATGVERVEQACKLGPTEPEPEGDVEVIQDLHDYCSEKKISTASLKSRPLEVEKCLHPFSLVRLTIGARPERWVPRCLRQSYTLRM